MDRWWKKILLLDIRIDPDVFWTVLNKCTNNPSYNNQTSNYELQARKHGFGIIGANGHKELL
jgi:hypothetical protein